MGSALGRTKKGVPRQQLVSPTLHGRGRCRGAKVGEAARLAFYGVNYAQLRSILLNPAQACSVLLNMHHVGSPTAIMGGKT